MNREEIKREAMKYALLNAIETDGIAKPGAVNGMVMNSHPQLRSLMSAVTRIIAEVIDKVNGMSPEEQRSYYEKRYGKIVEEE